VESNKETQGEDLIADFLDEKGIEYKREYEIKDLKEDNKFFRKADFYLPEYKVYIEFFGQWNIPEHKERYKEKIKVYNNNNIPCIYLWPDNLGTLDWMLRRRLREVLLKYNKRWTLLKFEYIEYISEYGLSVIAIAAIIYFVKSVQWKIGLSIFLVYHLIWSIRIYIIRLHKVSRSQWASK
jgi:hypothetical protein